MSLVIANQLRILEASINFVMAGFRDKVVAAFHANCKEVELKALMLRMVICE